MNRTKIPWCDFSWTPITGCLGGCSYCYARKMAHRFGHDFAPTFHPERLDQPAKVKKPSKIFVCSTSDLFGDGVQAEWIVDAILSMRDAPWHTYQLLTKRPERMDQFEVGMTDVDAWLGVTATDQASWDYACECLRRMPQRRRRRWISAEPVLGPIIPGAWLPDWVVIGPVTGVGDAQRAQSHHHAVELHRRLVGRVPIFDKEPMPQPWTREWPRRE